MKIMKKIETAPCSRDSVLEGLHSLSPDDLSARTPRAEGSILTWHRRIEEAGQNLMLVKGKGDPWLLHSNRVRRAGSGCQL